MPDFTPRDDELTDPKVRQLLWRLRARLVTPPEAERVEQDLARLLASAQEHAHDAPGTTDGRSGLEPVATIPSPDDRAASSGMALSRVAVGVVLLAALGGGMATAGGGPLSLQVLLGARAPGQAQPVELAVPEPPAEPAQDAGVSDPLIDLDPAEPDTPSPADPDVEVEARPEPAEPTPEPEVVEPVPPPSTTPAPSPAPGDASTGTGSEAPAPAPEPAPEVVEPQEAVEPPQEVLAAPPPRDLDGFGGPQPCPEGQDLASCLEDRASAEEAEEDSSGTVDDAAGDDAAGDDPAVDDTTAGDAATGDDATGDVTAEDDPAPDDPAPDDEVSSDDGAAPGEDATDDEGSGSEQDELARRRGAG